MSPPRLRRSGATGDGDVCPIDRSHGQMMVLPPGRSQYCPHIIHDGRPKSHPSGSAKATRNAWPVQFFDRAVMEYTATTAGEAVAALPELDMEGFDA